MKTLSISDRDLQELIAPGLRKKLAAAGFVMGATMDARSEDPNCAFYFAINLNLAGVCSVSRDADGEWTIRQEVNQKLAERTMASHESYIEACDARSNRSKA